MAKIKKPTQKQSENFFSNITSPTLVIVLLVIFALGFCIGMLVDKAITPKPTNDEIPLDNTEESQITTYLLPSNILAYNSDELNKACDDIISFLTQLRNDNTYIQIQVGDNLYDTYIYNKKGECFAQSDSSSYTSIALSDGRTIKVDTYSEDVIIERDTDVLSLMITAAQVAKIEESITFYEMLLEDESVKEYRIDVVGEENIRKIYSNFGEEVANNIVDNLVASLGTEWEPHLIYCYILDNKSATLYTYVVANNEEYINFVSQGHVTLNDWELSDNYYSIDINTLTYETACEMIENTVYDLEQILQAYALENGLIDDSEFEDLYNIEDETINSDIDTNEDDTSTDNNDDETSENNNSSTD